jgi:hypothetical protein
MWITYLTKQGNCKSYKSFGKDCRNFCVGQEMESVQLADVKLTSKEDVENLIAVLESAKLSFIDAEHGSYENYLDLLRRTD